LRDCYEIAEEARKIWNAMFDEDVETFSPIDSIISSACIRVEMGVIEAMADMLTVDKEGLGWVLSNWTERGVNPYRPVKSQELEDLIMQVKKDVEDEWK
jgi:hypothetical protein